MGTGQDKAWSTFILQHGSASLTYSASPTWIRRRRETLAFADRRGLLQVRVWLRRRKFIIYKHTEKLEIIVVEERLHTLEWPSLGTRPLCIES